MNTTAKHIHAASDRNIRSQTDYCGMFVYEDNDLQFIQTSEGRVVPQGDAFAYEYYLKDHLGNTRMVMNESGHAIQDNSYYPFGMTISSLSYDAGLHPENKFKYNGKHCGERNRSELQDDFGLEWYDYGARFYDAEIGRWHVVDPLAEKYFAWSPYNYVANNPIFYIDPDGSEIKNPYKEDVDEKEKLKKTSKRESR